MLTVVSKEQGKSYIEMASEILDFLNARVGRKYPARNPRGVPTVNAEVVIARLKEGYSLPDLKAVVVSKHRQWGGDDKMAKYLTPQTLFRRSNFERYLGELDE